MATRPLSDAQWSSHGSWQWTWHGWDRWPGEALGGATLVRVKKTKWVTWATSAPTWKQLVVRPWVAWTLWMVSMSLPLLGKEAVMSWRHPVLQLRQLPMVIVRIFSIHRRRLEPVIPGGVARILGRVGNLCTRHLGELLGLMLASSATMDQCMRQRGGLRGIRQTPEALGAIRHLGIPGMEPLAIGLGTLGRKGMATTRVTTVTHQLGQDGITGSSGFSLSVVGTDWPIILCPVELIRYFVHLVGTWLQTLSIELSGHSYLDLILKVIETKAGVRDGEERRLAFKRAMYQTGRKRDETLAQFAVRRLQDFSIATSHGINMPKDFQASLLKEGAGLSDQNMQNLTSLLHGQDADPDEVARCLGLLDVSRGDRVTGLVLPEENFPPAETYVAEEINDEESEDDITSEDEKHILLELEKLELGEEQAMEVYMALDSTHRRRTWKQSKQFKQEARNDRGHFSKNNSGSTPQQGPLGGPPGVKPSGSKPFRRRLNREQLKKVTKCRLCSKKGHWAEDCPLNKNKPASVQAFVFLSGDDHGRGQGDQLASFLSFAEVNGVLEQVLGPLWNRHGSQVGPSVYLTLTSGQAIGYHRSWSRTRSHWEAGLWPAEGASCFMWATTCGARKLWRPSQSLWHWWFSKGLVQVLGARVLWSEAWSAGDDRHRCWHTTSS